MASTKRPIQELFPLMYNELRRVAGRYLGRERSNHTLQPTALVNEAWLRLQNERGAALPGRTQGLALAAQAMRRVNPAYIPRNHRVEEALSAAVERGDYAPFDLLLKILSRPFDDQPEFAAFVEPAPEGQGCYQTFCGT